MSSIFSGANESELMGQKAPGLNEYEGRHLLKIKNLKSDVSKGGKHRGKGYFAADFEIVKSNNPGAPLGSKSGWVTIKDPGFPDYFFSDVKRFFGAVAKKDPATIKEESIKKALETQGARDRLVGAYVYPVTKKGQTFYSVEFFSADESTDLGAMLPASANDNRERAPQGAAPAPAEDDVLF